MPSPAEILAAVPMFALLDEKERAVLAERVEIEDITEGQCLFDWGDPGDTMYVLQSGQVELSVKTKTGEPLVLEIVGPGEFFGEISLLDAGPRTATAKVIESGRALLVDRGDLDELFKLQPGAAMYLLAATGKRLRHNAMLLRNQAARNVNEEIADQRGVVMRVADAVAAFSGTLEFLVLHIFLFAFWLGWNSFGKPFDPFPFNLLTMVVSLEAIMLSTLLLFSSNRQSARDKVQADIEYDVNLKAELQIQHLHEKVDRLTTDFLGRLDRIERSATGRPESLPPPKA